MAFDAEVQTKTKERLRRLSEHLKSLPHEQFDMRQTKFQCGSPSCIGGWALKLNGEKPTGAWNATELPGLTHIQALHLFYPGLEFELRSNSSPYGATPQQAARVLDHLIETGNVDWSVAFAEPRQ